MQARRRKRVIHDGDQCRVEAGDRRHGSTAHHCDHQHPGREPTHPCPQTTISSHWNRDKLSSIPTLHFSPHLPNQRSASLTTQVVHTPCSTTQSPGTNMDSGPPSHDTLSTILR
jgi:hypothetical protein